MNSGWKRDTRNGRGRRTAKRDSPREKGRNEGCYRGGRDLDPSPGPERTEIDRSRASVETRHESHGWIRLLGR